MNQDTRSGVFISYAREDKQAAFRLYNDLKAAGLDPWLDKEELDMGQSWGTLFEQVIEKSRYFIALFSSTSVRSIGVAHKLKFALESYPPNMIIFIPVRLDECEIPLGRLRSIYRVDLFPSDNDWKVGVKKIAQATKGEYIPGVDRRDAVKQSLNSFEFAIEEGDIAAFSSDVIALKYAQYFYGADFKISKILEKERLSIDSLRPLPNQYCYIETAGSIKARYVLFVGVLPLRQFTYKEIRIFAARVLDIVSKEMPHAEHIAMTIHGPGAGLDEVESLLAEFAGLQDAMLTKGTLSSIKRISIVDRNHGRVQRLRNVIEKNLRSVNYAHKLKPDGSLYRIVTEDKIRRVIHGDATNWINTLSDTPASINSAGSGSGPKPHVFVAMPFRKEMEDVFYFGIQEPSHTADLLCERIDNEAFTGDVLEQVKQKIETAAVVIADLTGGNPNVYLEIGYAWGKGRPTILLVRDKEEVKFDVRGQRYLKYETIKDLQSALSNELKHLKSKGLF